MSSADAQIAFQNGHDFIRAPQEIREHFAQQFDLSNPDKAMDSYQRVMHQHTKQQFEIATASSRRRSATEDSEMASLTSERSTGSMSSTGS